MSKRELLADTRLATHLVGRLRVVCRELEVRGNVARAVRGVLGRERPGRGHGGGRDADREKDGSKELAREHDEDRWTVAG